MSADPRHHLGRLGERIAAEHLERRGFVVLARNYRTRWGELDIVAHDGERTVFCEVKTRRLGSSSTPLEGFREAQQQRVRKMAVGWLQEHPDRPHTAELRFDAVGVTIDATGRLAALEHLEGVF
ncbi:YraN family protein [Conexibacter sp. CPCC 206217]|uniref:YraN family protein n=1 Tax=Conexibacter sp. CPCC 206217 TaxID=3064574 RepID=UPI002722DBE6|nr:YraN family protein [Conexibacter sp. CPCC 206217]MDO8212802.1 YraN family protein [Conexibacter sp. CPCC 206217]